MLQNLQIIIRLNGVPNNGAQTFQSLLIGLNISGNLRLAVEIERPSLDGIQDVLDLDAFAEEKPIRGFGEAVLERRRLGSFGGVLREDGSESLVGFKGRF